MFSINILKLRKQILIGALLYLTIASSLAISHGDTTLISPVLRVLFVYTQYVAIFLALICTSWRKCNKKSLLMLLPICVYYLFYLFDSHPFFSSPLNLLIVLPLFIIAVQSPQVRIIVYIFFYWYIVLMSILGIIASFSFIFKLGLPYEIVPYYFGDEYYINYYFAYLYWGGSEGVVFRLCGLFNEPGYFGTVSAILLINEKLHLKRISNLLLFIAGFFTFSAAFYALLIIYLIFVSVRKIYVWIIVSVVAVIISCNINYIEENIPAFYHLIERFDFNSKEGKFEGDNRTNYIFEKNYAKVLNSTTSLLWGRGTDSHIKDNNSGVLSYKLIIYQYGLLGFTLIYLSFFLVRIRDIISCRQAFFLSICMLLSIYQRPYIFVAVYFIIYYGALDYLIYNKKTVSKGYSKIII